MFGTVLDSNRQMLRSMSGWLGLLAIATIAVSLVPPRHAWFICVAGALTVGEIGLLVWWPVWGRAADERRPPDPCGPRTQALLRRYRLTLANMPLYLAPVMFGLTNDRMRGLWLVLLVLYLLLVGRSVAMLIYRPRHPLPDIPGAVLPAPVRSGRSRRQLAWMLVVSAAVLGTSLAAWGQAGGWAAATWIQIVLGTVGLLAAFVLTLGLLFLAAGNPPEGLTVAEAQERTTPLAIAAITVPISASMLWLGWSIAVHSRRNAMAGWSLLVFGGLTLLAGIVLAIVGIRRSRGKSAPR